MVAAPSGVDAVNVKVCARPLADKGDAREIDGPRTDGTLQAPIDCQPLLPALSTARPNVRLGPAKAVPKLIGITSVSVLPAAEAELPAPLTAHCELAIVPARPIANAGDQPVPSSSAS